MYQSPEPVIAQPLEFIVLADLPRAANAQKAQAIRAGQHANSPEDLDEALEHAQQIAKQRGIDTIYVADLTSEAWG